MFKTFSFQLQEIPDSTQYKFARLYQSDARTQIFERCEQLLRMLSRFAPEDLACKISAWFQPQARHLQERMHWYLSLFCSESVSRDTVQSLVTNGPLAQFYNFSEVSAVQQDYEQFGAVSEIIRYEEALQPLVPVEKNPRIDFQYYYTVKALEPNRSNDFSLIDRSFSGFEEPVLLEILVALAETHSVRTALFEWISRLLAVNAYEETYVPDKSEDLFNCPYPEGPSPFGESLGQGGSFSTFGSERENVAKDPLADEFLQENQELFKNLRQEQLRFSLKVYARGKETCLAATATVAESCFAEGRYQILSFDQDSDWYPLLLEESRSGLLGQDPYDGRLFSGTPPEKTKILRKMTRMGTPEELSGCFRLPVAGANSPLCIRKSTDPKPSAQASSILVGHDLEMGLEPQTRSSKDLDQLLQVQEQGLPQARLPLGLLNKHLFIAGASGSGKTVSVINLLVQLSRQNRPFLVIEPAKTEYRVLQALQDHKDPEVQRLVQDLRVYTPGNEGISPLRHNPFAFPPGISRDEHLGLLMACFKAGMPLYGPMEMLLYDAVEEVYRRLPVDREIPVMKDLLRVAREIIEQTEFAGELRSNLKSALEVRIGSLTRRSIGKIFSSPQSRPGMAELLHYPTIVETEHMTNESACLLILFLLSGLREQIRVSETRKPGSELQHVIVLEEAHNIIGKSDPSAGGEDSTDPKAFAAQYISRMLAELRALGEGIVIADQLPSAVAPEVIKNTGTKLSGRMVSKDDREELGGAMLLDPMQTEEIARLKVGEAYLYHEDLHAPRRVKSLDAHAYLGLEGNYPLGREINSYLKDEDWFQAGIREQVQQLAAKVEELSFFLQEAQESFSTFQDWLETRKVQEDFETYKDYMVQQMDTLGREGKRRYTLLLQEEAAPLWERVVADGLGDDQAQKAMLDLDQVLSEQLYPGIEEIMDWQEEILDSLKSGQGDTD